jgi:ADP-ribosylglycohydrolase
MEAKQRETIRLLLAGLAAGEGAGSSSEFVPQSQIPALYATLKPKGWPFAQVGGGAFNWKPGEATDDGDQALCLARSFIECGRFDPADVGKRLVQWLDSGPRDIGGTTARTLSALRSGVPWHCTGLDDHAKYPSNAANGSLMRNGVLPGIMFGEDLDLLFRATVQHSIITHAHPLAVLTCAAHSWVIADLLSEWGQGPTSDPAGWLDAFYEDWTAYVAGEDDPHSGAWLDRVRDGMQQAGEALTGAQWDHREFNPFKIDFTGRAGFCLLSLQIAVWTLHWSMSDEPFPVPPGFPAEVFERRGPWCMAWPALTGNDSDTTGAISGAILATAHGSVPESMMEGLEAVAEFDNLVPPCLGGE